MALLTVTAQKCIILYKAKHILDYTSPDPFKQMLQSVKGGLNALSGVSGIIAVRSFGGIIQA